MDNLNGGLGFKATLDIDDFNVSAQAMEKQIRNVSRTSQAEFEDMDNSLLQFAQRGAKYITSFLVGQGMVGLLQSITQVRGQFQQLEIAFETMLGSSTKAQTLMNQMVETAAKTPFDLMGVASGAKQLLAYGEAADKVNDTLVRLGNIASGLSIPLNDIVYLYGTTMVQGRLYAQDVRQFTGRGIPLVRELAEMYGVTAEKINEMVSAGKIGFADVEKVINKLTNAGGQFYNLMEKQSASLTGMISNLEDAWDSMLNEIGKQNQGALAGAIQSASFLVEHYEEVIRVLKAVAIGYGSVKAAIVLNTLVTKGYTGVALIDNIVRSAKVALLKVEALSINKVTLATKALWATIKANPLGWILSIVGLLISAFSLFSNKTKEAKTVQGEFQDAVQKEIDDLNMLMSILRNTAEGTKTHTKAIEKINAICKEYNATLLKENSSLDEQRLKYQELTKAIQANTAEKIKAKYTEQEASQRNDRDAESKSNLKNSTKGFRDYYVTDTGEGYWYDVEEIQTATDALFDYIEMDAKEAADKLRTLSGEEYTKAYNESLTAIAKSFKEATGASEGNMRSYMRVLGIYFKSIVESAKAESEALKSTLSQIDGYRQMATDITTETDYTTLSFSELETKIKDTQMRIDELNRKEVKVETDTTDLENLQDLLGKLNNAVEIKSKDLNTESGISARIKELREERSNVEINSQKYKDLTKEIENLSAKIPTAVGKADKNLSVLSQKQIESQLALEESKIKIMEEGYEKRKATLDLQHKRNLAQIEREELELFEARRKAQKGGLSSEEKEGFSTRRSLEDEQYRKAQEKLFDGEIDYKKKRYELYFQWVRNVGKDVADSHFATLLKDGNSFTSWVNSQIAILEAKKTSNPVEFTSGDANTLNQLVNQRDELMGTKSAMDLFKESVQQSVGQATTLVEKLQVISEMKERLANGDFNLNDDEKVLASYSLDEQDSEYQKELRQRVLQDYRSYEERKQSIQAEFAAMRLTGIAKNNNDVLDKLKEGEEKVLSELLSEQLKASDNWKNLFQNLDYMTAGEIQKLIKSIESDMQSAKLSLSPVDYKALMDSLKEAKNKVASLNPFKSLGENFTNYITSLKDLKHAEKQNLSDKELSVFRKSVKDSAQQCTLAIEQITQVVGSIGNTMASVIDSFGADGKTSAIIEGVTGALEGAGKAAGGVSKILSGDLIGGITDVISGIGDFIISLNGMSDAMHEDEIKDLQKQIDNLADSYDNLGDSISHAFSTSKADLIKQQNENLKKQNELIRQQIKEEEDKKKTDAERIEDWKDQIKENEKEIAENEKYNIIDAIMGTDVASAIDQLATAYADAWAKGTKAAGKSAETVKNLIKTAIIEQLKNKLQPEVQSFMEYLSGALQDGLISEAEENMLDEYQKRLEQISDDYLSRTGKWLSDDEEEDEDALSGSVRGMSEETGGVVAGRLNAVVINQSAQSTILRESLAYQAKIAQHTEESARQLKEIRSDLKEIKNRENSLLSQGIS